jgi:hypothetical protein
MAYTRGQNVPAFGIQLKPSFVNERMRRFFGVSIEREVIKYNKGKHLNEFKENLRLFSYSAFEDLSRYIGLKVDDSIRYSKDATTGAKFKPLARKTIAARAMAKGKHAKNNVPLALTGKLHEIATGRRIKNAGGNASSGSVQKDGIRLQQRVNYQPGESQPVGSFYWQLSGPKVRHLYGYNQVFNNVRKGGKNKGKSMPFEAKVPARPFVPKFTNSFFKIWKSQLDKDFKKIINASVQGSKPIIKSYGYVDKF